LLPLKYDYRPLLIAIRELDPTRKTPPLENCGNIIRESSATEGIANNGAARKTAGRYDIRNPGNDFTAQGILSFNF
jgi:hypothetical protein